MNTMARQKNGQLKDVQDQWNDYVKAKVKAATR